MTSVIHYRFKNTTEPFSTLTFEGQSLPLATLKQLIAQHKHLHRQSAHDFDLVVADAQTGDEYGRDDERIAKNAQVVVRRVPNTKAKTITTHIAPDADQSVHSALTAVRGRGGLETEVRVAKFVADGASSSLLLLSCVRSTATASPAASSPAAIPLPAVALPASTAPFQQSTASNRPHRRPPPGYLCKRCGSPDHFVQHCPLFPTPPSSNNTRGPPPSSSTPTQPAPTAATGPPADLLCPLCHNLYHNPMVVPCCFTSFCDECIRQALLWEDSYTCPSCQHRPVRLDELRPNDGLRKRVEEWMASRGQREDGDGDDSQQQTAMKAAEGGEGGAGDAEGGTTSVAADDDVSVILAEPSAGQLAHQAKRDKQQNTNSTLRCFKCGEQGHRAAQCPNRNQQQQPQQHHNMQQAPMHEPYMNGYGGGPMYNDMGMPMQPYGMGMQGGMGMPQMAAGGGGGYGGLMPMSGMGPSVPIYDDWGNFMGMQPHPMAQPSFYNQPPMPFMPVPPNITLGGGMMGMAGMPPVGQMGPLSDREAAGEMGRGWQHSQTMRHGDAVQRSPVNTAHVTQQSGPAAAAETQVETASAASPTTSATSATLTSSSPPSAAVASLTSSLLTVMPFVPPRSPPSSPPAATPSTTSAPVVASPAPSPPVSVPAKSAIPADSSPSLPSPSASPPASASLSPSPAIAPRNTAPPPSTTPAPTLSVVSYAYLPSTWNNEPRPLLLCLLSNHLRTLYAPSALLGSAFRLTQQLTTTPLYRVTADNVPPKGSKSSLLLTREGMVEWKRREGEGAGVAMAEDWKGKGGGWERVVEWMRGERQVRMVKVGEEWKEDKEEEQKVVEEVAKVEESKEKDSNRVSEVDRRGNKRKVETDSQGGMQVKLHRRDQPSTSNRDRERERAQDKDEERELDRDVESDDRRKRKRGGRREREKRGRREERQRHQRDDDNGGTQQQSHHRRRDEGETKSGTGGERMGGRAVVDRKQMASDDDRYRPPTTADDENDVFAMVMQQ